VEEFTPALPQSLLIQKPAKLEDLKFVFSQVEKRVKETADDGDKINSKSLTILGVCLTVLTALIAFIMTKFSIYNVPLMGASIYLIVMLVNVCTILRPNIYPVKYRSVGSYPSDLMVDAMFEDQGDGQTTEWRMIYSEILAYEERVILNNHNNDVRNELIKKAYDKLYITPILAGVCYLALLLLCFIFGLSFS
jgi:hypothetical protein